MNLTSTAPRTRHAGSAPQGPRTGRCAGRGRTDSRQRHRRSCTGWEATGLRIQADHYGLVRKNLLARPAARVVRSVPYPSAPCPSGPWPGRRTGQLRALYVALCHALRLVGVVTLERGTRTHSASRDSSTTAREAQTCGACALARCSMVMNMITSVCVCMIEKMMKKIKRGAETIKTAAGCAPAQRPITVRDRGVAGAPFHDQQDRSSIALRHACGLSQGKR